MHFTSLRSSMARRGLGLLAVLATTLASGGAARADVVSPPPETCPAFTRGSTCHGGPYCTPATCATTDECGVGFACRDVSLCVGPFDCTSGYGMFTSERSSGECAPGGCGLGACTTRRVCAPDPTHDAGVAADGGTARHAKYGCGCSLPGGGATLGGLSLVIAALCGLALRGGRGRRREPRKPR